MTDQELEHLIVTELESKRLDFTYSKDITEFFDEALFSTFTSTLRTEGYFDDEGKGNQTKVKVIEDSISSLISAEIKMTIRSAVNLIE